MDLLLQQAIAHHEAGRLPEAEALYRQILLASPDQPIAIHLLGVIAYQVGQHELALQLIDRAIELKPDYAEAFNNRGGVLHVLQRYQAAVESYDRAIELKTDYAEAYNNRGNSLYVLQQYEAAAESCSSAIALRPDYAEAYGSRGNARHALEQYLAALEDYDRVILLNAQNAEAHNNRGSSLHALLQYEAAAKSYDRALELKPNYAEARSNRGNALQALKQYVLSKPDYEYAKETEAFEAVKKDIARIAKIRDKVEMKAALDALPGGIGSHPAVYNLRKANFLKTEASGRDLVFYCGPTNEIWNPQTAETRGIGGSEESVVWLSRLLHERGWNVTVYTSCGMEEKDYGGVKWKPYWMWNCRDKQNVTVIWRHPPNVNREINSDKVIVDLHDVIAEGDFTAERLHGIHRIFVKSKFHRSLFPNIPDEKFVVIPNGIDANLFEGESDRDPILLINTSSADRSLEAFLDCFAEIRKQVPDAKGQWAYGWGVWDTLHSADEQRLEWKARMQQRMKDLGVVERGRINHNEIARLYHEANIFAYPSEMAEIDCISLSKAMAAGAIPITTDFAAMGEKAGHGGVFIRSRKTKDNWALPYQFHFEMAEPEQKAEFIREAVKLLLNPPGEEVRVPMREWARAAFDWNKVADSWNEALA